MRQRFSLGVMLLIFIAAVGWFFLDREMPWKTKKNEAFGGSFHLIGHNGQEVSEHHLRGKPSIVFFGFTHCPEVCPTRLAEAAGWLKTLEEEGKKLQAFFVTVDPERDTPEILAAYIKNISEKIIALSGEPSRVHEMARKFKIFWKKVKTSDGDYTIDHTASILLINRKGDFSGTIAYGENKETALEKLRNLYLRD